MIWALDRSKPWIRAAGAPRTFSFAAQYTDALGGLGVVGSGAHTPSETVDLASIEVMTKRAAVLVHRLTREAAGSR